MLKVKVAFVVLKHTVVCDRSRVTDDDASKLKKCGMRWNWMVKCDQEKLKLQNEINFVKLASGKTSTVV